MGYPGFFYYYLTHSQNYLEFNYQYNCQRKKSGKTEIQQHFAQNPMNSVTPNCTPKRMFGITLHQSLNTQECHPIGGSKAKENTCSISFTTSLHWDSYFCPDSAQVQVQLPAQSHPRNTSNQWHRNMWFLQATKKTVYVIYSLFKKPTGLGFYLSDPTLRSKLFHTKAAPRYSLRL